MISMLDRIMFKKVQEKVRETNQKLSSLRKREKKLQDALTGYLRFIGEGCQPVCADAVIAFNRSATSLLIPYESIKLSFDADEGLINMKVSLKYQNGQEPVEELNEHWVAELSTQIRAHVDREFDKGEIPFRFGRLTVPARYYEK